MEYEITINYNMRCIETNFTIQLNRTVTQINYNMRCIETGEKAVSLVNYTG